MTVSFSGYRATPLFCGGPSSSSSEAKTVRQQVVGGSEDPQTTAWLSDRFDALTKEHNLDRDLLESDFGALTLPTAKGALEIGRTVISTRPFTSKLETLALEYLSRMGYKK